MIIGHEPGLAHIGEALSTRGYHINSNEHINKGHHLDVYLYQRHEVAGMLETDLTHNILDHYGKSHGVLLVNTQGRNIDEVEGIIKSKLYSSLDLY